MEDRTISIQINTQRLDTNPTFKNNSNNVVVSDTKDNQNNVSQDTVSVVQENQQAAKANIISADLATAIAAQTQNALLENPEKGISALANYTSERVYSLLS